MQKRWGGLGSDRPVPGAVAALAVPTVVSPPGSSALSLLLCGLSLVLNGTFWATPENLGSTMLYKDMKNAQHRSFPKELCV